MRRLITGHLVKIPPEWWINLAYLVRRVEIGEKAKAILLPTPAIPPRVAMITLTSPATRMSRAEHGLRK